MAIPFRVSAMMVNLVADAVSLVQLTRLKETSPKLEDSFVMSETVASCVETEVPTMPTWYALTPKEILSYFCVENEMGLTPAQVEFFKKEFGPNEIGKGGGNNWLLSYLGQFKEFTSLLLLGTTVLSILTGDVFHGIAIGSRTNY
jgi:magnesium-transporting ATPase (P-type)